MSDQSVFMQAGYSGAAPGFAQVSRAAPPPFERPQDPAALKEAVRHQVEHYFSRENLMQDVYLCSQMDTELYVPIAVIQQFNRIRQLTTDDNDLLLNVISESASCDLDADKKKVRPSFAVIRTVIVVEGAPRDSGADVKAFVTEGPCGAPTASGVESNGSFAYAFADEETTSKAIEHVNSNKFRATIQLKAKVKLDTSFLSTTPVGQFGGMPSMMDPFAVPNPYFAYYMQYGYSMPPYFMPGAEAAAGNFMPAGQPPAETAPAATGRGNGGQDFHGNRRGGQAAFPAQQGGPRRGSRGGRGGASVAAPATGGGRGENRNQKAAPKAARAAAAPKGNSRSDSRSKDVNFSTNDFPALPSAAGAATTNPKATTGYKKAFKKYEQGSLLSILKNAKTKPEIEATQPEVVEAVVSSEARAPQLGTPFPKAEPRAKGPTPVEAAPAPAAATTAPKSATSWAAIAQKKDDASSS